MKRKLLGREHTPPEEKPDPLQAGSEPGRTPPYGERPGRAEPTLSERLKQQTEVGTAAGAQTQQGTNPTPREPAPPAAPRAAETSECSVVGESMEIKGELEAAEDLEIAGTLEGSVKHTADRLIVARTGSVKASIEAVNLVVEGRVEGEIQCRESVVLKATADVTGNIHTTRITIEDGARFNGQVVMGEHHAG